MDESNGTTSTDATRPGTISPGMAKLLRAGNGGPEPTSRNEEIAELSPAPPSREPATKPDVLFASKAVKRLVQCSLFLADLCLAALIVGLVLKVHGRLGFTTLALCVGALALGAWLTYLAFWLENE